MPRKKLKEEGKEQFAEETRSLKEEREEDISKWKHIPCSWIGRMNRARYSVRTTRTNLQIRCNPHPNTNNTVHGIRTKTSKVPVEPTEKDRE